MLAKRRIALEKDEVMQFTQTASKESAVNEAKKLKNEEKESTLNKATIKQSLPSVTPKRHELYKWHRFPIFCNDSVLVQLIEAFDKLTTSIICMHPVSM